jgi:hypothetical protein
LERQLAELVAKAGRKDMQVERADDENMIRHCIPLNAIPA